ncbi:TIM22 inner membrane protein import complex subunit Tim22 [Schizosaccharomyces japonicus yFS275]|uniref:Mitochondrial import inner membrane translocase subunit TIM22 n=1 Tax=Schizosaccharomyces japonicus (strain yFS275 / FY16936) TaxID=402676 RepID=B6JYH9_SCHJY|nr:TIM22 inner membrane protein import complex subunit Tim22 [Schizosaccharomyces japonicus yFS275]EEB06597.1 TIM22 inner membrane protein import complex subunit Tim22 [Schizosaccharomyces japonicus yFS275]
MSLPGLMPNGLNQPQPNAASLTDEEKAAIQQAKIVRVIGRMTESCVFKSAMSGVMGFGLGGIFGLFMSSLDIQSTSHEIYQKAFKEQIRIQFKDMTRRSISTGKNFGLVGLVYSGAECCFESYRAKTDMYNAIGAGFVTGGALAMRAGPKAAFTGGLGFAAFSFVIEKYMHWGE